MKKSTNNLRRIEGGKTILTFCFLALVFWMGSLKGNAQTTETFTANGSFIVPAGVTTVQVQAWGGGGAGGGVIGASASTRAGGGGSGGTYTNTTTVSVAAMTSVPFTIGLGGVGVSGADGGSGGTSTFASTIPVTAIGGGGGKLGTASPTNGAGGGTATGLTFNGGTGAAASGGNSGAGGGGAGNGPSGNGGNASGTTAGAAGAGTVSGGAGATGLTGSGNGNNASALSGGGSGGRSNNGTNRLGGNGFRGQILVTYTCPTYALTNVTTATGPFCGASTSVVTLRSSTMPTGTYTVTYNLSGNTTATGNTANISFTAGSPGTSTFTTTSLNAGNTTITITNITSGGCISTLSANNTASVVINTPATAVAGTTITTCSNSGAVSITTGATATNTSGVLWTTNGTGTLTNPTSLTLCTYLPSAADIAAGSRVLTLTSTGNSPCANAVSTKTINITAAPTVFAGADLAICYASGAITIASDATATNQAGVTWTRSGTGTLTNATSLTTCTYTPSAADITAGSVTLTLTATANAGCSNVVATKTVTLTKPATAVAGTTITTCSNSGAVSITTGATATNTSGVLWTTNGTGTLTNPTSLTLCTYLPSSADIAAGSRTLTLTATGNSPCANAVATKTIIINSLPTVEAGTNISTCSTSGAINITAGASATNQASVTWTRSGTGTLTNATSLTNCTYTPSAADIAAGTVTLTLTANPNAGCSSVLDTKIIIITTAPSANAGTNILTCATVTGALAITAGATATNMSGIQWTSNGTGTFTNATSLTLCTYEPSTADIVSGSVVFTLTALANSPCGNAITTKTLTISTPPTTSTTTICQGATGNLISSLPCAIESTGVTGSNNSGTGVNNAAVGSITWTNPENITTSGTPYATIPTVAIATTTNYLHGSNYGFSIPANAIIDGITLVIRRQTSGTFSPYMQDDRVSLVKNGIIQPTNKALTGVNWSTSLGTATYGGVADNWGSAWTAADINNANFGVVLSAINPSTSFTRTATVDYMQITVNYSIPGTLHWYTVSSGGTPIGSGSSFNPVGVAGSGLVNTNTPGSTTFYAACSTNPECRTATNFVINANTSYYRDADNDGYGNSSDIHINCTGIMPSGYVLNNTDCNDADASHHVSFSFYVDTDKDGYGAGSLVNACGTDAVTPLVGYAVNNTDCDNNNASVYQTGDFYVDADNDGYYNGNPSFTTVCYGATFPSGYTTFIVGADCDDSNAEVHPGHVEELNNSIDDNCSGPEDDALTTPLSNLYSGFCGITLISMSQTIYTNQVAGAEGYRFEVTRGATKRTIDSALNSFSFAQVPGANVYGAAYTIRVAVKMGGFYRAYGAACVVTSPLVPDTSSIYGCGSTLTSLHTTLYASPVAGASGYRFRVTNGAEVRTFDSPVSRFSLAQLTGTNMYGTTYTVDVALRFGATWRTEYSPACSITTPATPPTTRLIVSQCGRSINNLWATLYATPSSDAVSYRFEVVNGAQTRFFDTPNPRFSLMQLAGGAAANTTYTIRVAIFYGGIYQPFGPSCTITTTPAATRGAASDVNVFEVHAYPNPFAQTFQLDINTSSDVTVALKVYDMIGRLVEQRNVALTELGTQEVGNNYPTGVYNIVVTQGKDVKTLRVIKR